MKVLQTLVGVWKELQRFVMHKNAGTPDGMPEGGYYYDTVQHAPLYHDGTSVRPFGVTAHDKLTGLTEGDPHPQYVLGTEIGVSNGVAGLDASGRVPSSQLPAFVDDVLEFASLSAFPATGESGKLYLAIDSSMLYRWTGSTYAQIAPGGASLVLGETSSTAYRGDRGAQAYAHALQSGNPHGTGIADISGLQAALDAKMSTASNPDLVAIEALAGTSGLLKKTAANTWALDTTTYTPTSKLTDGSVTKVGTVSVGSTSQPIYLNAGTPTAITGTIGNSTTGNAATATKLATARAISLSGDVTGSANFDGSGNISITTAKNYEFDYTGAYSATNVDFAMKIASWVPTSSTTYSTMFEFDYAGVSIYPWQNLPFSVIVTYRDGNFNVYYEMIGNHAGYSRIYCGMNGTTAEIWVLSYGSYIRFKGRMVSQSHAMYNVSDSVTSTIPSYLTNMGNVVRDATNADTLDGYHLVIQPLRTARTAPNTVFYCY